MMENIENNKDYTREELAEIKRKLKWKQRRESMIRRKEKAQQKAIEELDRAAYQQIKHHL